METPTLYEPRLSEQLRFPHHLLFGFCSFVTTLQILKHLPDFLLNQEGEELCSIPPLPPPNCSISAGESQRGSVLRCADRGSILGVWWGGWFDNTPLEESRNRCRAQCGQPDFSLMVSLF